MRLWRHSALLVVLVLSWCALWGGVSVLVVLSGIGLGGAVVAATARGRPAQPAGSGRIRFVPLARLTALVAVDVTRSTIAVAREVLTPGDQTDEAIIAVPLPPSARAQLLLLVVGITITPGVAVVDADPRTGTLYLHLLHHHRAAEAAAGAKRLAELAEAALPSGPHRPEPRTAS